MPGLLIAVYLIGEARCYHCGEVAGVTRMDQMAPSGNPTFVPANPEGERPIRTLSEVRCPRCGGPTYLGDLRTHEVWSIGSDRAERPRRGRSRTRHGLAQGGS